MNGDRSPNHAQKLALAQSVARLHRHDALTPAEESIVRLACTVTGCTAATVALAEEFSITLLASRGLSLKHLSRAGTPFDDVVVRGTTVILTGEPARQGLACSGLPGWSFCMGHPLVVDEQAIGVLMALSDDETGVSPAARTHFEDLARLVGTLWQSALNEQRARRNAERYRTASRSASDWLWETDAQGRLQWVSEGLAHHIGMDPTLELGLVPGQIYRPRQGSDKDSWERYLAARARHEPFHDTVAERDSPKGTLIVSISGHPCFDAQGQFRGYRGSSRNITEQVKLEARAQLTDQLLRQAFEAFHAGVMISEADGRIIYANQHWRVRTGVHDLAHAPSWPQLLRRMIDEGRYPEAIGREEEFFQWRMNLISESRPVFLKVSGTTSMARDVRLNTGHVVHFSTDVSDLTSQARSLQRQRHALADSEARLATVLAALPDLWIVIDAQGCCAAANETHPLLVMPFQDMRGRPFGTLVPAPVSALQLDALRRSRMLKQPVRIEYDLDIRKLGLKHIEARFIPMPDGQTLFLARDLTEVRDLTRQIHTLEQVLRADLGMGVVLADTSQFLAVRVLDLNPSALKLLGAEREEVLQQKLDLLWESAFGIPLTPGQLQAICAEDAGTQIFDVRPEQGTEWLLELQWRALPHEVGEPHLCVLRLQDITEQHKAAQAERARERAEAASRAKSEFVSRMSHEIRTPLNAVRGFAQLLERHPVTREHADIQSHVHHIQEGSAMLADLVNDILDLQHIESDRLSLLLVEQALEPLLHGSLNLMGPLATETGVRLLHDFDATLAVRTDRRRIQQVFNNLLSNAIKYNRPGGIVRMSSRALDDDTVCIDIEDTGSGLTSLQQTRLFQPFERLGKETSQIEGTGLGLIISQSLVEAMGGRLRLRSQPGQGTCVSIDLPRSESVEPSVTMPPIQAEPATPIAQPEAQPEATVNHPDLPPLRVLYVEDNRINALLFEEALRISDLFSLEIAEDGHSAVDIASRQLPEVLVIDAHLPGMTGFDVLRMLRVLPGLEEVPAYMCSADALPDDIERALREGFNGYWTKPIDIQSVTSELTRLANQRHSRA